VRGNFCYQAVTLKFRPLSIHFTSESFEAVWKMSIKGCYVNARRRGPGASFSGTANTQRALVGVEREFVPVEHPSFVEIEARRVPRRVPAIIH